MSSTNNNIQTINLEQAKRAVLICVAANLPVILWGGVGVGKSTLVRFITEQLLKWRLFDVRGSDKEPQDFGGIPYPDANWVRYLMPSIIPWKQLVGDTRCILFADEIDRCVREVMNVLIQLFLDRKVNGNELGENVRIIGAGNGTTDSGTSEITDALATRTVHLYIETSSEGAKNSYDKWAESNGVSEMMRGFVQTRATSTDNADKFIEHARETGRTRDMADKIIATAGKMNFKTNDIMRPLLCGTLGFECGMALLNFNELFGKSPRPEDIIAHPESVDVPDDAGILYAITISLCDKAVGDTPESAKIAEAFCKYFMRWPAEPQGFAINRLEQKQPRVVTSKTYQRYLNNR